jgi:hypothetical protein
MTVLVTILAILFWGWVLFRFGRSIWASFIRPSITDPEHPPDLRAFAPPTGSSGDSPESDQD